MPWIRLSNFEYAGYIADIDAHALSPNTLSYLQNAHCVDGVVKKYMGWKNVKTLTNPPLWLLSGGFSSSWLLAATAANVYQVSSAVNTDISNISGHTPVAINAWTGGVLHGIGILNNAADPPQYWAGGANVADLTAWTGASDYCRAMRVFKNYLFALGMNESSTDYPTVVRWSTPADPGSLPADWDYTDPTNDSGRTTLSETPGEIVDGLANGEVFHIYKEDCIYDVTFIGGVFVFKFTPRHYNFGLLARNCAVAYAGRAYALGSDDVVVHLGSELKSIASRAQRRRMFNILNATYRANSFVAFDPLNKELMFCIPVNGKYPDRAFTYNPVTERWGERDLPSSGYITYGKTVLDESGTWDSDSATWESDVTTWGSGISLDAQTYIANSGATKLATLNTSEAADGANMSVIVERKSIDFGTEQNPNERIKHISRVRPNVIADAGTTVFVQLGSQMQLGDDVTWDTAQSFVVGTDRDICTRVNGRYISWRVYSQGQEGWSLESLDVDVKIGAMW